MLKKYGIITLLVLGLCGVRSALASCVFSTPTGGNIVQTMTASPVTAVTLTSTEIQQLFRSSVLVGGPVSTTCSPSTGDAMSVSGDSSMITPLPETTPDGGVLMNAIAMAGSGFGYGFWYSVTYGDGSGSASGHLKDGYMFSATPAQLNGAKWEFWAELWYAGGTFGDRPKASELYAVNSSYFRIGFDDMSKRAFYFNAPAIPITPTTCNLSLGSPEVDFGEFDSLSLKTTKSVRLYSNTCSMVSRMELRILSNGNPVDTNQNLLLNKLTGDNAASGFGLWLYPEYGFSEWGFTLDAALGQGVEPTTSYDGGGGFLSSGSFTIYMYLKPDGTTLKAGDFEATATLNVSYY